MDQYEFWDIFRKFTTLFCASTPDYKYAPLKKEKEKGKKSKINTNENVYKKKIHIIENFIEW